MGSIFLVYFKTKCSSLVSPNVSNKNICMKVLRAGIPDILILEPAVYADERGFFLESYNKRELEKVGIAREFVQDNHSRSVRNVLRGLHYQIQQPQGKLVRVIAGEIFDVAVDIRKHSPSFGRWIGVTLAATRSRMLWIPEGFAHGFLVLSESAETLYKTTDYYVPDAERTIIWNDPDIGIDWPIERDPILSVKDDTAIRLRDAEVFK